MNRFWFAVTGEDRQQGAIGIFEPFQMRVKAADGNDARDLARAQRYDAGREHVHCKTVTRERSTAAQRHLAAIEFGAVTKTNIIGIRKALNRVGRLRAGWSGNRSNVTPEETDAIEAALAKRAPAVIGPLHDSGLALLRSPRNRRRFTDAQREIINSRHVLFTLVRFDRIGSRGENVVPVYRVASYAGNFLFRNIPWQSASYMGEESGPVVQEER